MPSPPYPPNLAPRNSSLRLKTVLKKNLFAYVKEVKQKIAVAPEDIKIDKFKNCSEQWKECLNRYIATNGEYFEDD